ncbi:kinase-like domain-containing protein, partial [Elsinoe ampelina]
INDYEIIDELGRGTHGKVKLGRSLTTGDFVAIKIVERFPKKRRLGRLGNAEDKVKREVAILKKARHPHIVALLEVIDDPARRKVYIVLERVDMGEIPWRQSGPKEIFDIHPDLMYVPCMTMQAARESFRDTLLGLQYLHYQNIIHRDIKPPNLLQTRDYRTKISDFGVSYLGRPIEDADAEESETDHDYDEAKELAKNVGTAAFYAPELCITDTEEHPPIGKAIDVWALGVTLFCMIFARVPFVDNEWIVMRRIAEEEVYIPNKRLRPVDHKPQNGFMLEYEPVPDDLIDLLKLLLTKDARKRISLEGVRHHPWVTRD